MLNSKNLSKVLTRHVHPQLFPRWFLMSPNATLLAYSTPANIQELRDQATLIAMSWKEQYRLFRPDRSSVANGDVPDGCLETLTIELEDRNIIIRAIQPRILLVLVGNKPAAGSKQFRLTPETRVGGSKAGTTFADGKDKADEGDDGDEIRDVHNDVLRVQRRELDAATEHIRRQLSSSGFVMPEDQTVP
ncbi:hypothetical protein EJ06DRAFT_496710 [Trichodelitschia bisporula]|uniref:Uncharacterized protein n=1 Tax=Trichodelitschia bisporula TaxID=703511 RepID=A0A6G1HS59_9PEZI|nr:hypothetical protein EJ06DRAFT_496710 [Trichodelitschia bisporula]